MTWIVVLENPIQFDLPEDEFLKYQSMSERDIPNDIWKSIAIYKKNTKICQCIIWPYLSKPKSILGKIALSVFTILHSNTAEELMFSMLKTNNIAFTANLEFLNR